MLPRYALSVPTHNLVYLPQFLIPIEHLCPRFAHAASYLLFNPTFDDEKIPMPPILLSFFRRLSYCQGNGTPLFT